MRKTPQYGNAMARNFKEQAKRIGPKVPTTVLISELNAKRDSPAQERLETVETMRSEMRTLKEEQCRVIVATLFSHVDLFVEGTHWAGAPAWVLHLEA